MRVQKRGKWSSWIATTSGCFVVGLLAVGLFVKIRYGTVAAAAHAWRGDVILCDRYDVAINRPQPDQMIAFQLTNTSSQSIRVLGARSSCTCAMATGLPLSVAPGATKTLEVRFKPKKLDVPLSESIGVFTDRPGQQIIPLTISTGTTADSKETRG